jgi:hypothetical protein
MAKWNFTASTGKTGTIARDEAWITGLADAYGKNATVTRDTSGNVTKVEIPTDHGTATYTRP